MPCAFLTPPPSQTHTTTPSPSPLPINSRLRNHPEELQGPCSGQHARGGEAAGRDEPQAKESTYVAVDPVSVSVSGAPEAFAWRLGQLVASLHLHTLTCPIGKCNPLCCASWVLGPHFPLLCLPWDRGNGTIACDASLNSLVLATFPQAAPPWGGNSRGRAPSRNLYVDSFRANEKWQKNEVVGVVALSSCLS